MNLFLPSTQLAADPTPVPAPAPVPAPVPAPMLAPASLGRLPVLLGLGAALVGFILLMDSAKKSPPLNKRARRLVTEIPPEEDGPLPKDWDYDYMINPRGRRRFRRNPASIPAGMNPPPGCPLLRRNPHLSTPSKMPCHTFALPAVMTCPIGAKLRKIPGTVCSKCYAKKGLSVMPDAKGSRLRNYLETRRALKSITKEENWVETMANKIRGQRRGKGFFRWHDSGDMYSAPYFDMVLKVIRRTPEVQHWIPTKELPLIRRNIHRLPSNVNVRWSAPMIGQVVKPPFPLTSSSVSAGKGFLCPATYVEGKKNCGTCRACWSRSVKNVDYKLH